MHPRGGAFSHHDRVLDPFVALQVFHVLESLRRPVRVPACFGTKANPEIKAIFIRKSVHFVLANRLDTCWIMGKKEKTARDSEENVKNNVIYIYIYKQKS